MFIFLVLNWPTKHSSLAIDLLSLNKSYAIKLIRIALGHEFCYKAFSSNDSERIWTPKPCWLKKKTSDFHDALCNSSGTAHFVAVKYKFWLYLCLALLSC